MKAPVDDRLDLRTLLSNPQYKAWYCKVPTIPRPGNGPPWRVWVLTDAGRWAKAKDDFAKYSQAFNWIRARMDQYPDMVLYSKPFEFRPPVLSKDGRKFYWGCPDGHRWCGYCRRPTRFRYFSKHHAMSHGVDPAVRRCEICGCREAFLKRYKTQHVPSFMRAADL